MPFLPSQIYPTARYLCVPLHGLPYNPFEDVTLHEFTPSHFFLIMSRGLSDEQDVVLILGCLQVVMSVRPYVASMILMIFLSGHFNVADLPSHIMFSISGPLGPGESKYPDYV